MASETVDKTQIAKTILNIGAEIALIKSNMECNNASNKKFIATSQMQITTLQATVNEVLARLEALQAYNTTVNPQSFGAIANNPPTTSSAAMPSKQKVAANGIQIPSNVTGWFKLYGIKENLEGNRDKYMTEENVAKMKSANKSFANKKETDPDYYTSFGQALWNHKDENGNKTLTESERAVIKTEFDKWKNEQQTSPASMTQLEEEDTS